MRKTIYQSIRAVCLVSTFFITSQVMAQDACVSGTVPVIGCIISSDDGNYDLTGDITPTSGLSAIRFINADRNTFNHTGNISSEAYGAMGVYVTTSTFNNITINGNINIGASGLYGILSGPGTGNNTIIMNGNITTNRYAGYGYFNLYEDDTNFTLNGNITTNGDDAPGIVIYESDNANITLNGNINVQGGTTSVNGRGIDIFNSSGITITNLGTITTAGDDPYDIYLRGTTTVATLNNRQSGLTYYGKIPTNYNAVINSTSDYGKIIFSTVSGTTSFGIYAGSVLKSGTTYASVIDGLESSNITAGNSGDYSYDGKTWAWTLENSSANLWDLIVGSCAGCITEDTQDTIEEIGDSIGTEFSQILHKGASATSSFANMNTYDCDLFDKEGKCYSIGGRHTDVNGNNDSDSSSSGAVFVFGNKFNKNFRVSAFIDQQVDRNNAKGLKVHNKGPMIGGNLVWNQFANHLGFQVRAANAFQAKDMTITRSEIGEAEAGVGETEIEVQSYVAEVSYQFSDGDSFFRPYLAARRAIIKQDSYTETGVANPLTYNTVEDKSTTIVMGMKARYRLNHTVTLNGALGVENDISNKVDKIQATSSTITGITPVDINTSINKTRPVVTLGATYHIAPNKAFSAQAQYQELSYTRTTAKTLYFNYTVGF
ncbi:autotransporter domain-containing protein [Gammaproteobacteria bacterium]|nr:autotransporter domain-containing protein [Gammaproteobacteria bacterium]